MDLLIVDDDALPPCESAEVAIELLLVVLEGKSLAGRRCGTMTMGEAVVDIERIHGRELMLNIIDCVRVTKPPGLRARGHSFVHSNQ